MKRILVLVYFLSFLSVGLGQKSSDSQSAGLTGRVTDYFGLPLRGSRVMIQDSDQSTAETVTDELGNYEFKNVAPGKVKIRITNLGFQTFDSDINISLGELGFFDVGLKVGQLSDSPSISIRGKVVGTSGDPLNGASVNIVNVFDGSYSILVRTDKNGVFESSLFRYGQYLAFASSPGFVSNSRIILVEQDNISGIDFRLLKLQVDGVRTGRGK